MTANIRTPQRTVSAMQRFAVSQKNHAEAITISPFLLSLPYRTENRRFSALSCTKTGSTQPKLSAACFVVQSCLADADFVVFSDYCLIGTRRMLSLFMDCYTLMHSYLPHLMTENVRFPQKRLNSVSLRGRNAAVAILKSKVWHSVAKHGSTKQEEIPIAKNMNSLRRFASSFFISRFCFVPPYHSSLRNDKSFRQRLPRRAHAPSSQ